VSKESIYCLLFDLAPPKINREPEEQRVQLGETLKVKIPISGKGPFTFKVKKNDEPLADSDRVRVQEFDDYIVVTIPGSCLSLCDSSSIVACLDADRDDAGKYGINVANDSGSCNIPLKVKVIGRISRSVHPSNEFAFFSSLAHSSTTSTDGPIGDLECFERSCHTLVETTER
jgi:hypothetical protein